MTLVVLPQLSLSMAEGKLARWLVADGERVSRGQVIAEIETDKSISELEAPTAGTIRRFVDEGALISVQATVAEISDAEAPAAELLSNLPSAAAAASVATTVPRTDAPNVTPKTGAHRASPAARRIARERGVDLGRVQGMGPGDRITARDLEHVVRVSEPLREAVISQLIASWREIPHIHISGELDGTGLAATKAAAPPGVTVTDLLVLALVRALADAPELNGTLGNTAQRIHVALAVATPMGVVSPVIRNAEQRSLLEIAAERARLVAAARAGESDRRDLGGGTITLTNLGAYPVDFFAPIVSGPQIATLAIGRLIQKPVVLNGVVEIRHRLSANVAIDHRGADGIAGARLLAALEHWLGES